MYFTLKFFKIKEKIAVNLGSQHSDCIEKAVELKKEFKNPEDTLLYLTDSLKAGFFIYLFIYLFIFSIRDKNVRNENVRKNG